MDRNELFDLVAEHRIRLCDQLAPLPPAAWDEPSLCQGWRVREVLAHLVTVMDIPAYRFVIGTVGLSGFHRRADHFAREHGQRDPAELVARYRELAGKRRTPPVIGPIAPLTDVVVHALDIGRPLGLEPVHTAAAGSTVLAALSRGLFGFNSRRPVRGLRFEAPDLGWAGGDGPVVRGPSADLLLALTGRAVAVRNLEGDGVAALRARLGR